MIGQGIRLSALVGVFLCAGCIGHQPAHYGHPPMPSSAPMPPDQQLAEIDRDLSEAWHFYNYEKLDLYGGDSHPTTREIAIAWSYVDLGRDYFRNGDLGGGARSYWASLQAVGMVVSESRLEKERVREAAFRGLQSVARVRGEQKWALILGLCADLANAYVTSPEGIQDDETFKAERRRIEQEYEAARLAHQGAEAALQKQRDALMLRAQLGQLDFSSAVAGGTDLEEQTSSIEESYAAATDRIENANDTLLDGALEEGGAIDPGRSFLAAQVSFYLRSSRPELRRALLDRIAAVATANEWNGVQASVSEIGPAAADTSLDSLVKALAAVERDSVLERVNVARARPSKRAPQ